MTFHQAVAEVLRRADVEPYEVYSIVTDRERSIERMHVGDGIAFDYGYIDFDIVNGYSITMVHPYQ